MTTILRNILFISIVSILCVNSWLFKPSKKLKLVLGVFRHGDRTPVFTWPTDPPTDEKQWPDGFHMLTTKGKQRMHSLGKYIRKRYKNFLTVSPREAYVRSSAKQRCLESASLVMAGLYPPTGRWQWNSDIGKHWQPFPINTVEFEKDGMLNPVSICPKADKELKKIFRSKVVKKFWKKHEKLRKLVANETKLDFNHYYVGRDVFNVLEVMKENNYPLPKWANETVYKNLSEFMDMSFIFDSSTQLSMKLRAGLLLKDMAFHMNEVLNDANRCELCKSKLRIILYSTHDTALTAWMQALDIYSGHPPPYGATVFVELYEMRTNNGSTYHKLEFRYLNVTESERTSQLYMKMCYNDRKLCLLDQFLISIEKLIPTDWEQECRDDGFFTKLLRFGF